jgi:hypothetical protein
MTENQFNGIYMIDYLLVLPVKKSIGTIVEKLVKSQYLNQPYVDG